MENLKQLIHSSNNNPLIINSPLKDQTSNFFIKSLVPWSKAFHFIHHDPQKVGDLKKRFKDAAEEERDRIDLVCPLQKWQTFPYYFII